MMLRLLLLPCLAAAQLFAHFRAPATSPSHCTWVFFRLAIPVVPFPRTFLAFLPTPGAMACRRLSGGDGYVPQPV